MIWFCATIREFFGHDMRMVVNTMESLKDSVAYCPMLVILFVDTRGRAFLFANNEGVPQGWVQDGTYMATWAIF